MARASRPLYGPFPGLPPHGSPIVSTPAQGKLNAPSPQPLSCGGVGKKKLSEKNPLRSRAASCPMRSARCCGCPVRRFCRCSGLCRCSCVFAVEVFCCVCVGCCGGGCGLASGVVALSSLLLCCVAWLVVVVCGGSLSVVAVLRGSCVAGSSVASCFRALSVGGAAFRCSGVVVACVGVPSVLLGAGGAVPVGVVGGVAGGGAACASSFVRSALIRAVSLWGRRWGGPFFYAAKGKNK